MSDHETTLRATRLLHYVAERRKMLGLDTEHIHALHSPPSPRHAELLLSDVEAGADALRRERQAAERKAQFVALQQRIAGHLDACIYCENALTSECAVGRALLKDSKDYYAKDAPTETTR